MGSDYLPPGVSESDLPGNRPIDGYHEKVMNLVSEELWEDYEDMKIGDPVKRAIDVTIEDGFHNETSPEITAKKVDKIYGKDNH